MKPDNRIGACRGRFQSPQLRMFCSLEPFLALDSIFTKHVKRMKTY